MIKSTLSIAQQDICKKRIYKKISCKLQEYLSIYLSIYLYIFLSIYLSIYLSINLYYIPIYIYLSLSIYLKVGYIKRACKLQLTLFKSYKRHLDLTSFLLQNLENILLFLFNFVFPILLE